jgi:hypothetical protein
MGDINNDRLGHSHRGVNNGLMVFYANPSFPPWPIDMYVSKVEMEREQ